MSRFRKVARVLFHDDGLPIGHLLAFGWMPSALKRWIYARRGYRIAPSAKIGLGAVIVGNDVEIGDEARIGMLTIIKGRRISIAPRVRIGMMTVIDTPDFEVGEGTRIGNQVVVGGLKTPQSGLRIGCNSILMEWSFINTSKRVEIGNDVGIGGHCLFFTHGLWPNGFEGFPVSFGPIVVKDQAWLAWRVSVLPGVTIGEKSIVSSDACVNKNIPALALAAGVPAKVLREGGSYIGPSDLNTNVTRLAGLMNDFNEWVAFHGGIANTLSSGLIELSIADRRYYVGIDDGQRAPLSDLKTIENGDKIIISLPEISEDKRAELDSDSIAWFDIARKERSRVDNPAAQELEEFFRRFGFRMLKYGRWPRATTISANRT